MPVMRATKRLMRLDLPDGDYRLEAIYRTDAPPGPAASWLIARFQAQAGVAAGTKTNAAVISGIRRQKGTTKKGRRREGSPRRS
jgi:hypothetical protein